MRYSYTKAPYDELQLHGEVVVTLSQLLGVGGSGSTLVIDFAQALTAPQKAQLDSLVSAHVPNPNNTANRLRADAKLLAQATNHSAEALRAVLLVAVDEINALRQRLRAQDAAIAAAASLADLKTRWAALVAVPDRAGAQAKQAILDKIDAGGAD